jgi:hypothetical protein
VVEEDAEEGVSQFDVVVFELLHALPLFLEGFVQQSLLFDLFRSQVDGYVQEFGEVVDAL